MSRKKKNKKYKKSTVLKFPAHQISCHSPSNLPTNQLLFYCCYYNISLASVGLETYCALKEGCLKLKTLSPPKIYMWVMSQWHFYAFLVWFAVLLKTVHWLYFQQFSYVCLVITKETNLVFRDTKMEGNLVVTDTQIKNQKLFQ